MPEWDKETHRGRMTQLENLAELDVIELGYAAAHALACEAQIGPDIPGWYHQRWFPDGYDGAERCVAPAHLLPAAVFWKR